MFAVPPSPKSLAASSFDPASHSHSQHSHQHAHSSLQLPKLDAPPSPTLLPLPHAHLLGPLPSPGGTAMSSRPQRPPQTTSSGSQRRRRQPNNGTQRGSLNSALPPPHPHPYAHGPIHTAPSFYRTLSSSGTPNNAHSGGGGSGSNGHNTQNRSHSQEPISHPHTSSPTTGTTSTPHSPLPSSGPGPARTPRGTEYRRVSAVGGHLSYAQTAKARHTKLAGAVYSAEAQAQDGASSQQQQQQQHVSQHSPPTHHGHGGGQNESRLAGGGGPGLSGAGGPGARHHLVSPPPNLPPVHHINAPNKPDSPTLPAIHTGVHADHNSPSPSHSSGASGMPTSPATQAPRLVPVPGHSGGGNSTAGPSSAPGGGSTTPGIRTPPATQQHRRRPPPPSDAGSMTDTDVTPTPSIAGTPGSGLDLSQIPLAFVLQRLHQLAGQFWSNPRSSDIRLIVPMPAPQNQSPNPTDDGRHSGVSSPNTNPSLDTPTHTSRYDDGGAAASSPGAPRVPAMSYALHRDYLVPQSSLFRTLLCERVAPGAPELKGCRILPNTSLHGPRPVYVPLPDPESFGVLVHWMYWGDVASLENALNSGTVSWRGVVANIQYLGLDDRTKRVVGRWWRRWGRAEERANLGFDADADTDDDDAWDDEDDDDYSPWGAAAAAAAGPRTGNAGPPRAPAPISRRRPGAAEGPGHASGLGIARPHGPGHAHSHFHSRGGLDLLATASEREYDADEMSKRLGLL